MRPRQASVRIDGQEVGRLDELESGGSQFAYAAAWLVRRDAVPVSLTLPLRADPYVSRTLHPFFENLLPEGWLLELSVVKLKIARDDVFGLLLATCADCVGAVEIVRIEEESP